MDDISYLVGKTITSYDSSESEITFHCSDGSHVCMYHEQDCCEYVRVEDISGDLGDLVGHQVRSAYASSGTSPSSGTYTFYHIRSFGGSVCIRWLGESNGYYSESVSVEVTRPEPEDLLGEESRALAKRLADLMSESGIECEIEQALLDLRDEHFNWARAVMALAEDN